MVDTCANGLLNVILKSPHKKDTKPGTHKVTFSEEVQSYNYTIDKNDQFKPCSLMTKENALIFADGMVETLLFQVTKSMDNKLIQHYVDNLFFSILKSLEDSTMRDVILHQAKVENYAANVAENIVNNSLSGLVPSLKVEKELQSTKAYAGKLVEEIIVPVVQLYDEGLETYCDCVARNAIKSATECAFARKTNEAVACIYAEKLSLRVFRDFFIHIITDAKTLAYHMLGSYEAVSKNMLDTFAGHMAEQIIYEIIPTAETSLFEEEQSLIEWYSDNLAKEVIFAAGDMLDNEMGTLQSAEKSKITIATAEYYAAQIMQNFTWDSFCEPLTSQPTSSTSLQLGYDLDYYDVSSESVTPRSATDESGWKRGLYHFADQLLYSLAALERDCSAHETVSSFTFDSQRKKVKRSGSCPHILQKPMIYSREFAGNRRQSETVVRYRINVINYADELASSILHATLSSAML